MGKVTGFLEIDRQDRRYKPASDRIRHFKEFVIPLSEEATRDQAARCMNCGVPYCMGTGSLAPGTPGCPVNNQIPDWNDLVYRGDWRDALLQSAFDQQLPGGHRPRVPGAVRSVLHAQPDRDAGHHQDDRMRDRRPRLRGRLDRARAALAQDRQEGFGDRLRPRRHGLRAAARARRPRGAPVREVRARRRPAHLRHSRLQDGEASRRKARCADGGRRRRLPLRRACRRQHAGRARHRRLRRGGADRRRGSLARPADPGPRTRRDSFRDGLPAAAEPPHRRRAGRPMRRSRRRASMWW